VIKEVEKRVRPENIPNFPLPTAQPVDQWTAVYDEGVGKWQIQGFVATTIAGNIRY